MEEELHDEMTKLENPTLAPYAKEGELLLRVTASAKDNETAEALISPVVENLAARYKEYVYGIDIGDLQNALVQELKRKNRTIATAESCTGGLISKRITEIDGSSMVFRYGACTYHDEAKMELLGVKEETLSRYGAVSRQTAMEMAQGIRLRSKADLGISVTGIAGPSGGTPEKPVGLVYIGLSTSDGCEVKELYLSRNYGGEREHIRWLASSHALFMALRKAQSMEKQEA